MQNTCFASVRTDTRSRAQWGKSEIFLLKHKYIPENSERFFTNISQRFSLGQVTSLVGNRFEQCYNHGKVRNLGFAPEFFFMFCSRNFFHVLLQNVLLQISVDLPLQHGGKKFSREMLQTWKGLSRNSTNFWLQINRDLPLVGKQFREILQMQQTWRGLSRFSSDFFLNRVFLEISLIFYLCSICPGEEGVSGA